MNPGVEIVGPDVYAATVATHITGRLPSRGAVVITGGTTAAKIYGDLDPSPWGGLDVFFSDERCVPPDHDESNFKMATDLFLSASGARVHRMEGELEPTEAARRYHDVIQPFVPDGIDLMLLGLGADCHIGALYPSSSALEHADHCAAVRRPDGIDGLTLTPRAMLSARAIVVLVTGETKSRALVRVLRGDEEIERCPARLLMQHPRVTFLVDEAAASLL